MSLFANAFLGSGVPLAGDPITSFQNVSLLELRTGTVVNNCKPTVRDVVKTRFMATNSGDRPLEIIPLLQVGRERDHSEDNVITLLAGETIEYTIFRSWETPGEYQLTLAYEARRPGQPFARLAYPKVTIQVSSLEASKLIHWISYFRTARLRVEVEGAERWAAHS